MVTIEDLDKRLSRLETLHLWGGIIVITLIVAYFIFKK